VQELTALYKRTCRIYPNCGADFRVGTCADEVSETACTLDAGLIITASHHTSFLGDLLNFQQAPKIMHRAPIQQQMVDAGRLMLSALKI
jgi:hypothetical protein